MCMCVCMHVCKYIGTYVCAVCTYLRSTYIHTHGNNIYINILILFWSLFYLQLVLNVRFITNVLDYNTSSYAQVDRGLVDSVYADNMEFVSSMQGAGQGRELETIKLQKPLVGGLGFSVVGLKSENRGELGIFVQDLQPGGVAQRFVFIFYIIDHLSIKISFSLICSAE